VTSPIGVTTFTEHNDFGERVLERSRDRGDMRFEYDPKGAMTKRQRSQFKSASSAESTCFTSDWLGRRLTTDWDCNGADWTLAYDGENEPGSTCPASANQKGQLSKLSWGSAFTRVLCYHPGGALYAAYQINSGTWSTSNAKGTNRILDLNGNLEKEYWNVRPSTRSYAREIEYVADGTLKDRLSYIRHKLTSAGSWTNITSSSTLPTYFALGGMKTLRYNNGITETLTRDYAGRLKRRKTDDGSTVYTDINLTFDLDGNITLYDDSAGLRHLKYYAAVDKLNRLRCLSRSSIGSCSGSAPWEDKFNESFDLDASGNRTNRRFGAYDSDDEDIYRYWSGPTDVIKDVTQGGFDNKVNANFRGDIEELDQPEVVYSFDSESRIVLANDTTLGQSAHQSTIFGDRFLRVAPCNDLETHFFYTPDAGGGGASHEVRWIDAFNTCEDEFPRLHDMFVHLEGRPIAILKSTQNSGGEAHAEVGTFWIHADHLGTPVLVTQSDKAERWRWENDPFGRSDPIEFQVQGEDVDPDDDPSYGDPLWYNTCCCDGCGSGCNECQSACDSNACDNGEAQDVVWSQTYNVSGANNIRIHFSTFDVAAGSSHRTEKDFVQLMRGSDNGVVAELTGDLGDFWSPWAGEGEDTILLDFWSDNEQDETRGFVVDKLEYTTDSPERFTMLLRMPGQLWDADVGASYNYQRWYRREDGRYLTPDPIGLAGGEPGYYGYAAGNPIQNADPTGLQAARDGFCVANGVDISGYHAITLCGDPDCGWGECLQAHSAGDDRHLVYCQCMCCFQSGRTTRDPYNECYARCASNPQPFLTEGPPDPTPDIPYVVPPARPWYLGLPCEVKQCKVVVPRSKWRPHSISGPLFGQGWRRLLGADPFGLTETWVNQMRICCIGDPRNDIASAIAHPVCATEVYEVRSRLFCPGIARPRNFSAR
jgi:RHS repeat-associated protein